MNFVKLRDVDAKLEFAGKRLGRSQNRRLIGLGEIAFLYKALALRLCF